MRENRASYLGCTGEETDVFFLSFCTLGHSDWEMANDDARHTDSYKGDSIQFNSDKKIRMLSGQRLLVCLKTSLIQ